MGYYMEKNGFVLSASADRFGFTACNSYARKSAYQQHFIRFFHNET